MWTKVRIEAGDNDAWKRLLCYIVRCPFSIARVVKLGSGDSGIYRAAHDDLRRFPLPQGDTSSNSSRESVSKFQRASSDAKPPDPNA